MRTLIALLLLLVTRTALAAPCTNFPCGQKCGDQISFFDAGTECRPAAGACDLAEVCTGDSLGCPADVTRPVGTLCRAATGDCGAAEYCTGAAECPMDEHVPANSTLCRAAVGGCDAPELCSGSSPACPADELLPAGAICQPSGGACDPAEVCSGDSAACPADAILDATHVCRPASGVCDVEERCAGDRTCPDEQFREDGSACDDGNACTATDQCSLGVCVGSGGPIVFEPNPVVFDPTTVGAGSQITVRVRVAAGGSVGLVGVEDSPEFMLATGPQWPIALTPAAPETSFRLDFVPASAGTHNAVVDVRTDLAACTSFPLTVRGVGLPAELPPSAEPPAASSDALSPLGCAIAVGPTDASAEGLLVVLLVLLAVVRRRPHLGAVFLFLQVTSASAAGPTEVDEIQSRALFEAANRELDAGRHARALELYEEAERRYPRASILANRAAALVGLGRRAEAADVYAQYLAHPQASSTQVPEVRRRLAVLDSQLGRIEFGISEPDAVIVLDGHEVGPSPQKVVRRVAPGRHEVAARKQGFTPAQAIFTVDAGERRAVVLDLLRDADPPAMARTDTPAIAVRAARPSRLAAVLRVDIDGVRWHGAAAVVGLSLALGPTELSASGILGPTFGAELGASLPLLRGRLTPVVTLGVPLYFADAGALVGLSASAGMRWRIGTRLALHVALGGQHFIARPEGSLSWLLVPSAGVRVGI